MCTQRNKAVSVINHFIEKGWKQTCTNFWFTKGSIAKTQWRVLTVRVLDQFLGGSPTIAGFLGGGFPSYPVQTTPFILPSQSACKVLTLIIIITLTLMSPCARKTGEEERRTIAQSKITAATVRLSVLNNSFFISIYYFSIVLSVIILSIMVKWLAILFMKCFDMGLSWIINTVCQLTKDINVNVNQVSRQKCAAKKALVLWVSEAVKKRLTLVWGS